jgi:hypothetical protein
MTDFDAIYVEDLSDENQEPKSEQEAIIVRGNGNLTM